MALTKTTTNDLIQVVNKGDWSSVEVRTATIIQEDGVEISRSYHRHALTPDADLTQQDADVAAIAGQVFTDDAKAAYAAHLAAQSPE